MNDLNKLYTGDCFEILPKLTMKVDLVLTDPPYNLSGKNLEWKDNKTGGDWKKVNEQWDQFDDYQSYLDFSKEWIKLAKRVLNPHGAFLICCSYHSLGEVIIAAKENGLRFLNCIVWKKTNPMPNMTKRMLTHSTEFILWFSVNSGWTYNYENMKKYRAGKQLTDVWELPSCQGKERLKNPDGRAAHPTQKPEKLFERLIEMTTKRGDVILDPFMGSGTTAVVAEKLGRKWIGIEKNIDYINLAKERLRAIEGQTRL